MIAGLRNESFTWINNNLKKKTTSKCIKNLGGLGKTDALVKGLVCHTVTTPVYNKTGNKPSINFPLLCSNLTIPTPITRLEDRYVIDFCAARTALGLA